MLLSYRLIMRFVDSAIVLIANYHKLIQGLVRQQMSSNSKEIKSETLPKRLNANTLLSIAPEH